jgi:hypothetical protein
MKIRDKKRKLDWKLLSSKKGIWQTGWYKEYQHNPPVESDKERQAYWADIHEKLLALKSRVK